VPAAPDVTVQVAHLAGAGSWEDEGAQQVIEVFAVAIAKRDPRTRLLYFDFTALGTRVTAENARVGCASQAASAHGRRVPDHRGQRAAVLAIGGSSPRYDTLRIRTGSALTPAG
jgi:hypothetical protein